MAPRAEPALGRPPALLLVPSVLAVVLLVLPLLTLIGRTPWRTLPERLTDPAILDALWLSLWTATAAMVVAVVLGLPLAWLLARVDFPGRSVVRALVTIPLVLPPVVAGVALLTAFGRSGLIGGALDTWFGWRIPFTTLGVVVAHTFVVLPFFVITVEGAMRSSNRELETVAGVLGASRWTTFRRVTVPLALPGIAAGMVLGWARSLGEFGATITFNGNFPGTTRTMPLAIYTALQSDPEAAYALSLILLVVCVAVLALLRERWLGTVAR